MQISNHFSKQFSQSLLRWYQQQGRKDLPWQQDINAYRVWCSEIMLQQTQVKTVIPYFERFMQRFPSLDDLAASELDEVLALWSGLGYYSRARNLHKTAQIINTQYCSTFPHSLDELIKLPGLGRSTASAITSIAYNQATPILDGNVKRVLTRCFMIEGWPEQSKVNKLLWTIAEKLMPKTQCAEYTQAIMDLGAMCCTRTSPQCQQCPLQDLCHAYKHEKVSEFPHKKPKIKIPTKRRTFIIISDDNNKVLLHKRPPTGIWGGLWCLPITECETTISPLIKQDFGVTTQKTQSLMQFKHRFSHFELECNVVHCKIEKKSLVIGDESSHFWAGNEQLSQLGLAKPVALALKTYFNKHCSA